MFKAISRSLFKKQGWSFVGEELVEHRRCVVIAAPHTSNWDLVYTVAAFDLLKLPVRFTIKDTWMKFPFSLLMEPAGGLAIDRSPRAETGERPSMVDAMIELFEKNPGDLALAVTPEGTRGLSKNWKSGFYHVARGANVPILLGYLDYDKREAGIGKVIHPSGDIEADMREISDFYRNIAPKFPEKFSLDERYDSPVDATAESAKSADQGDCKKSAPCETA